MQTAVSFALVAELVDSHKDLAPRIAACVKGLTQRWPTTWLAAPMIVNDRQRITAVLKTPCHAFDFLIALNLEIWPSSYRLAIASGKTKSREGPAFERAVASLHRAEQSGQLFATHLAALPTTMNLLLESSVRLHADIMQDWKPSRKSAAAMIRKSRTQQDAAASLGIRQQSVSEALRAAHAKHLESLEDAVRLCLAEACA